MRDNFSYQEFINTVNQQLDSKRKKTDTSRHPNMPNKWTSTSAKGILLILDDVSSKKDWEVIKSALPEIQHKVSQVIITTRDPSIKKLCDKSYKLPPLQDRYSFELFKKKVKVDFDGAKLTDVANEIVTKCCGIPQVIITVAVSLQERPIIKKWENTRDHLSAELENNPKLRDTNRILTSGYKNLPSNLKSCFLYMSVFPEDGNIRRRCLVRRWIAEGYSSEKHGMNAEEVADKQFQNLISRNMIQPSRTATSKISTSGEPYYFGFQTLMHSISRRISAEENHVLVLDEDEHSFQSKCRTRHLTVISGWSREDKKSDALESVVDLSCLRSLTVFGEFKSFFISKKMRLLRVLDLEDTYGLRCGDLSSILKLYPRRDRYLSLRGSQGIFHLPDSFGNLPNLETLDVRDTLVTELPSSIVKLKKLKYLRAGMIACNEDESCSRAHEDLWLYCSMISEVRFNKEPMEEYDLKMLVQLIWLMANVWLRGLDQFGVKVPRGIGKLKFLQTLGVINVARGKKVLKEIKKLTWLRKLGVTGINRSNCKELVSAISNQGHLQSLSMRAEGKVGLDGCLDEISPPGDLQSLKLYGNLGKLPEWIVKLQSLVKLTLRSTLLKQDAIEILGKLENLATLRFQEKSFKDEELNFPCDTFAGLMVLEIGGIDRIKTVKFEGSTMSKLKVLLVKFSCGINCRSDVRFTGIQGLPRLMEVQLHDLDCGPGPEEDFPESDPADDWLKEDKEQWARNRAFKEHLKGEIDGNKNSPILNEYPE